MSHHADSYWSAVALLIIVGFTLVVQRCSLLLVGTISPIALPLALAVGLATLWATTKSWRWLCGVILGLIAALLLSWLTVDNSVDGQLYHQEMVVRLLNGWNPNDWRHYTDTSPWVCHYPMAIELCAASVSSITGDIESGKLINFIIAGASLLMAYSVARARGGRRTALIIALAAACNPVVVVQLFTFYIDGAVYVLTLITLCLLVAKPVKWWAVAMTLIIAGGVKYTALLYCGLALICWMGWEATRRDWRPLIGATITGAVAVIAILTLFWHPYITNYLFGGHPLYPLAGDGAIEIMSWNTPEIIQKIDNRFANFFVSIFWPSLPATDKRLGAFGPVFGIVLLLAIYGLLRHRRRLPSGAIFACVCILASCFVLRDGWWGRYAPQIWLLPVIAAWYLRRRLGRCILAGCAICIACCVAKLGGTVIYSYRQHLIHTNITEPIRIANPQPQQLYNFERMGIPYEVTDSLNPDRTIIYQIYVQQIELSDSDFKRIAPMVWRIDYMRLRAVDRYYRPPQ